MIKFIDFRKIFLLLFIILFALIHQSSSTRKRCFACRSRGNLGDCKDPFEYNATTFDGIYGSSPVELQPCASGWCGKSIEDENEGPHIMATERMCLLRPPSDGKERCSKTFLSNSRKTFYMCFCKGDLCNSAGAILFIGSLNISTIFSISGLVIFLTIYIMSE
ncbi:UPAR/Ly6 domain-containing protein rtv [Dermatophagoides farinae]|uniref:Protein sleepless n=1 Tax=Dermatophagoides farinae TaxID=6954 RepID=A0A922LC17_DERFA|nr:uncharacterized protein LOC124498214 [Dermatophagoides farinae]KAH9528567.1 hypothetical protein DERF_002504 [Dermatophagoides farinae]